MWVKPRSEFWSPRSQVSPRNSREPEVKNYRNSIKMPRRRGGGKVGDGQATSVVEAHGAGSKQTMLVEYASPFASVVVRNADERPGIDLDRRCCAGEAKIGGDGTTGSGISAVNTYNRLVRRSESTQIEREDQVKPSPASSSGNWYRECRPEIRQHRPIRRTQFTTSRQRPRKDVSCRGSVGVRLPLRTSIAGTDTRVRLGRQAEGPGRSGRLRTRRCRCRSRCRRGFEKVTYYRRRAVGQCRRDVGPATRLIVERDKHAAWIIITRSVPRSADECCRRLGERRRRNRFLGRHCWKITPTLNVGFGSKLRKCRCGSCRLT